MKIKNSAKIRIRLESFNHELLTSSCQKLIKLLENVPLRSLGIVSLPTCKRIYCVLRSPHVNKDSREHFEIRVHTRMLEIWYDPELLVHDILLNADLPSGIFYRISKSYI